MDSSTGRIVVEQGMEGKFAAIAEPVIEQLGYRLVRVKISGMNGATVQFMAERPDGTMSVEDCAAVSRALSPVLDVEDPFDKPYHLEISSPGIDRPLVRKGDFEAWTGHLIKLETERLVGGRKRFRGKVVGVGELSFQLERDQAAADEEAEVEIPFDAVAEARLILTDELISAALKADKDARKARGEPEMAESAEEGAPPAH